MVNKDEILKLLPHCESTALTSRQIFDMFKGSNDIKEVSDTLGNLWRNGTIQRAKNTGGKLAYYNPLPAKHVNNSEIETSVDDSTNEQLQQEQATVTAANTFTADDAKLLEDLGKQNPLDVQIGGDHYKKLGAYQPWQVLQAWLTPEEFRGYMKGTAIAYLARERDKGGDMDIEKSKHTLEGLLNA